MDKIENNKCCACSACYSICPTNAISMNIDEKVEVGLLYTADPIAAHAAHEQQTGLSYNDPHII